MGLLRLPRVDDTEGFVLVRIDPLDRKAGTLDAKILATEGSAPFVLNLKQSQVRKLKSKKSPCTDEQWEAIVEAILLQQESDLSRSAVLEGIEVGAAVEEGVAVEIIFKRSTSGITQRLGSIRLLQDEDQEIELFDWCGASIQDTNSLTTALKSARSDLLKEQAKSQTLYNETQELLKAKADHENELLEKFSRLLNEKKAKIRSQQRLLEEANIAKGPDVVRSPSEETKAPPAKAKAEKAGPSRRGKRKAETPEPEPEPEEMDIDEELENGAEDEQEMMTRDTSDEETTENDDVEDEAPAVAKKVVGTKAALAAEDGSATESEDDGL